MKYSKAHNARADARATAESATGAQPLTVLFTEHSMDVVFGYAQRVLVMARGRLIADGTPAAVRADPAAQAAYFGEPLEGVQ